MNAALNVPRSLWGSRLGRALMGRSAIASLGAIGAMAAVLYVAPPSEHQPVIIWAIASLVLIYLNIWIVYRLSRRAIAPLVELAEVVESLDAQQPDVTQLDPSRLRAHEPVAEIRALAQALHSYANRIHDFIDREQNFTRDASHELRSPLTVIKVAVGVLLESDQHDEFNRNSLLRIRDAARDMEALMEALLLLARDSDTGLYHAVVNVNSVTREEIERSQLLLKDKPVTIEMIEKEQFVIEASVKVVAVLVGNLIRNACQYTEQGAIQVIIERGSVTIKDSGVGMTESEVAAAFQPYFRGGSSQRRHGGHGVGLSIVKRLSDRFGWPVELSSQLAQGTSARVEFPDYQVFR